MKKISDGITQSEVFIKIVILLIIKNRNFIYIHSRSK